MRWLVPLTIICLGMTCCTTAHDPYSDISDAAESPAEHFVHRQGQPGDVLQKDRDFVYRAILKCLYDVELADQAATRAASSAVRDFAQRTADECRTQMRNLALLNEQHIGIPLPSKLDRSRAAQLDQLGALTGRAFDKAYVQNQIATSEEVLELFREQGTSGNEPILQRFAAAAVPELEQRHSDAQRLGDQSFD